MKRSDALDLFDLTDSATEKELDRKYRQLALQYHPDKPRGTKEQFQQLSGAYELLKEHFEASSESDRTGPSATDTTGTARKQGSASPAPRSSSREDNDESGEEEEDWRYSFHYEFFSFHFAFNSEFERSGDDSEEWAKQFRQHRETVRNEYERRRTENLRQNYDYRDRRSSSGASKCYFCKVNDPITKSDAINNGINWEEYSIQGYRTCWNCKNKHISVMTENTAIKKFAKKLAPEISGPYGKYRFVFWDLRKINRFFHHQPRAKSSPCPTRNSKYYCVPDLEDAALARGWKPREKTKDGVQRTRKFCPGAVIPAACSTPKKKRKKTAAKVTPDR
jgi:curved DNA-binding protein CbpA